MSTAKKSTIEASEGEDFIAEFLDEKGYDFKQEYMLEGLKNDTKRNHRRADFFLPRYGACIEFLGKWDDPKEREEYKTKMSVFFQNRVPCVYIWPDNLGTLDWTLRRRIRESLLKFNKRWSLFIFEFDLFLRQVWIPAVLLVLVLFSVDGFWNRTAWVALFGVYMLYKVRGIVSRLVKLRNSKNVAPFIRKA
ncbi:MAG: hypothetical protein ACMXYM_02485 [Candidatus Woesearchaeota archaeon]